MELSDGEMSEGCGPMLEEVSRLKNENSLLKKELTNRGPMGFADLAHHWTKAYGAAGGRCTLWCFFVTFVEKRWP